MKFLVVGGATFVIYFFMQYVLVRDGFGPLVALSAAYLIALTFHFISNALYTFKSDLLVVLTPARLAQYFVVNFFSYLINLMFGKISLLLDIPVQFGMATGVVFTTFSGFIFYDKYVFKKNLK